VRRPIVWWTVVALVAAAVGIGAGHIVDRAAAVRSQWGRTVRVAVMTDPVAIGEPVSADHTELRSLPRAVVPDGALTDEPDGRVALADLHPGEILLGDRLAPDGLTGPAALLGPGTRALAVPTGPGTPPLAVGDTVDLLATVDPLAIDPAPTEQVPEASAVARGARVVAVGEASVTVAVTVAEAPGVAVALAQGAVSLALAGGP
jgi:Flp pilus assembly protein CpaB